MDFVVNKKEFLKGLSLIQGITGRRTTLPILSHILLEWQMNLLSITGTDLETAIKEDLNVLIYRDGKASVSAKKLYEIVRELPEEEIQIEKNDETHWITIRCGKSTFNLAGLDPEEFPTLPTYKEEQFSQIPSKLLRDMIEKTSFAASNEESRYHLNGIFLVQKKKGNKDILRMVATDGHRLSLVDREIKRIQGIDKGVIIPKKGILEIKRVIGDIDKEENMDIYFNQTNGFFRIGKSLMIIRLIEGEFPEYEQVIPKDNDKKLILDKYKIYGSLKRVSTMVSERGEGIKLLLKNNLMELSSFHQDFGDAKEEVEIFYEGPPFEIGFNVRYLLEALNVIDTDQFTMEFKDEGSPCLIKPNITTEINDQLCIIMPMRI